MGYEQFSIKQGKLGIIHSDDKMTVGYMIINNGEEIVKHARPLDEEIFQLSGNSVLTLYENGEAREITLNEGDAYTVPANIPHGHINKNSMVKSITLWKFHGDMTGIVEEIKRNRSID